MTILDRITVDVSGVNSVVEHKVTGRDKRGRQSDFVTSQAGVVLEVSTFHHGKQYVSQVWGVALNEGGLVRSFSLMDSERVAVENAPRFSAKGIDKAHTFAVQKVAERLRVHPGAYSAVLAKAPLDA